MDVLANDKIAELIIMLDKRDREAVMAKLSEYMCMHCYALNPKCRCWNDE